MNVDTARRPHLDKAKSSAFGPIARHPIEGAELCACEPQTSAEIPLRLAGEVEVEVTRRCQSFALLVAGGLANLILERQRFRWKEPEHRVHDVDPLLASLSL